MRNISGFVLVGKGADSLYAPGMRLLLSDKSHYQKKKDEVASFESANPVS